MTPDRKETALLLYTATSVRDALREARDARGVFNIERKLDALHIEITRFDSLLRAKEIVQQLKGITDAAGGRTEEST